MPVMRTATFTYTLTASQRAQVIAALALAAQQYADPSLIYETLNVVAPGVGDTCRAAIEAAA